MERARFESPYQQYRHLNGQTVQIIREAVEADGTDQHTPGIWVAQGGNVWVSAALCFESHVPVGHHCPADTIEANARLIAAAPAMLDALRATLPRLDALDRFLNDATMHSNTVGLSQAMATAAGLRDSITAALADY